MEDRRPPEVVCKPRSIYSEIYCEDGTDNCVLREANDTYYDLVLSTRARAHTHATITI